MDDPIDDEDTHPAVKLASLLVLGLGLTLLFVGHELFWVVFAVGFAVVVPMVKLAVDEFGIGRSKRRERTDRTTRSADPATDPDGKQDALDTLRERYARGDLSEAEFERKVDALLGTETPESARRYVETSRRDEERTTEDADLETDERAK